MERPKMRIENRAKQFMPFAALKGYPEALAAMEKVIVPKAELSEERADELDRKLREIKNGYMVEIVFYNNDEYEKITGLVSRIDAGSRYIKIVNTKVNFDDIFQIEILKRDAKNF